MGKACRTGRGAVGKQKKRRLGKDSLGRKQDELSPWDNAYGAYTDNDSPCNDADLINKKGG